MRRRTALVLGTAPVWPAASAEAVGLDAAASSRAADRAPARPRVGASPSTIAWSATSCAAVGVSMTGDSLARRAQRARSIERASKGTLISTARTPAAKCSRRLEQEVAREEHVSGNRTATGALSRTGIERCLRDEADGAMRRQGCGHLRRYEEVRFQIKGPSCQRRRHRHRVGCAASVAWTWSGGVHAPLEQVSRRRII